MKPVLIQQVEWFIAWFQSNLLVIMIFGTTFGSKRC